MPGIHRNNDARVCGARTIAQGQSTVYINGELAAVEGDPNTHGGGELIASVNPGTVFIGGKQLVAEGSNANPDNLCSSRGHPHCNPKATGSSGDVFVF